MQAIAEPEGGKLSYSTSLKKFFCFNLQKKRCSKASYVNAESSLSFFEIRSVGNYFLNSLIVNFSV